MDRSVNSSRANPYLGPRPFTAQHQDLFFGRERELLDLTSLVMAHREVLVYAASGAGKTSLINAGLAPELTREGCEVLPVLRVKSAGGETSRTSSDNVYLSNVISTLAAYRDQTLDTSESLSKGHPLGVGQKKAAAVSQRAKTTRPAAHTGNLSEFLESLPRPVDEVGEPVLRVLIFDQFEELFTTHPEHWQARPEFLRHVSMAVERDPHLRVMFVIREDYLAHVDSHAALFPTSLRSHYRLERLRAAPALSAVAGPVERFGVRYAPGAAEALVDELVKLKVDDAQGGSMDVIGEFVEPVLLQVVCQELWSHLDEGTKEISQDHVKRIGDVHRALERFYEGAVALAVERAAEERAGVAEADLRDWIERIFITSMGTRNTVYQTLNETAGMPNLVIDALSEARLIRPEWRAGARWYELTHDRLIGPIRDANKRRLLEPRTDQTSDPFMGHQLLALSEEARLGGRIDEALELASRASEIYEKTKDPAGLADGHAARGRAFHQAGRLQEALDSYGMAVQIRRDHANAWHNIGTIQAADGKQEEAAKSFDNALDYDPFNPGLLRDYASTLTDLTRYEEAEDLYRRALAEGADPADVWNRIGYVAWAQKRYDDALAAFRKAQQTDPQFILALTNEAIVLQELGLDEEAVDPLKRAHQAAPEDPDPLVSLGDVLLVLDRKGDALDRFRRATTVAPDNASAWAGLARALGALNETEEALRAARRATEVDPNSSVAWNALGAAEYEVGSAEHAVESFGRAVLGEPVYVQPFINLAATLLYLQRTAEAEDVFRQALEIDPQNWEPPCGLANTMIVQRRLDEAREWYERGIALASDRAMEAYVRLAAVERVSGSIEASTRTAERGLSVADASFEHQLHDQADLWELRGLGYLLTGQLDEALDAARRAASIPDRDGLESVRLGVYELLENAEAPPDGLAEFVAALGVIATA